MVEVTLDNIVPSTLPADGWKVEYRIKGTLGAYITPVGSPYSAFPIVFNTTDPAGTLYEGRIWRDCGSLESTKFNWVTPCDCTHDGFVSSGINCKKTETVSADITNLGYCLALSRHVAYGSYGTRIYAVGFSSSTPFYAPGTTNTDIYGEMTLVPQWANTVPNTSDGPLNREGVWIDSDCNGSKDPLTLGAQTTISFMYNNVGAARRVYVGVGADNQFVLKVNGAIIVDTGVTPGETQFKFWHLIPVNIIVGINYFNVVATGDGSVNDAMGMVVYDNTAAQLFAATSDAGLNILFHSSTLRGTSYDTATCPDGYSLDTSGGAGTYVCVRTLVEPCNGAE